MQVGIGAGVPLAFIEQLEPGKEWCEGQRGIIDEFAHADSATSIAFANTLAAKEGLLVGPSTGSLCLFSLSLSLSLSHTHTLSLSLSLSLFVSLPPSLAVAPSPSLPLSVSCSFSIPLSHSLALSLSYSRLPSRSCSCASRLSRARSFPPRSCSSLRPRSP